MRDRPRTLAGLPLKQFEHARHRERKAQGLVAWVDIDHAQGGEVVDRALRGVIACARVDQLAVQLGAGREHGVKMVQEKKGRALHSRVIVSRGH